MNVYLDHAAATPLRDEVRAVMEPYLKEKYGNPSSLHTLGRQARVAIDEARETVASVFGCNFDEIIFTNGGTESDNLAILGTARSCGRGHIITSKIEHPAVLEPCQKLEKEGFLVTYLDVDKEGLVNPDDVKKALREDTILVSIMYANNEIGTIQPIAEIANMVRNFRNSKHESRNPKQIQNSKLQIQNNKKVSDFGFRISDLESATPILHTDACQAAGALDMDVKRLGVNLMTINGSKIYGPKGIGVLYVKKGVKLEPLIYGGAQEDKLRAGTENVAGIVGLAKALELVQKDKEKENKRQWELRDYLIKNLIAKIPKTYLNGHPAKRLPNNANLTFLDAEGESILLLLDEAGIYASTGSACASGTLEPSHVLLALGQPRAKIHGSVRFTLGRDNTKKDIDYLIKTLPPIVERLRKMSPVRL